MVLQLEDCVDILKVTHPDFDVLFLFDHSNGHDKLQPNGLSLSKINIGHGGKQPSMRSSLLSNEHFGPFHNTSYNLQPGMFQSMQYQEGDIGPCYLTEIERIVKMNDKTIGTKVRVLNKCELIMNLKEAGICNPKGTKKQLQQLCESKGNPLAVTERKIDEGWARKSKGAKQILFERGWIDPTNIHFYTEKGKKMKA